MSAFLALGVVVVFGALLHTVVATNVHGWASRVALTLVRRAASRFPAGLRDRYEEEWRADLMALSGLPITQLLSAIRITWYSSMMAGELRVRDEVATVPHPPGGAIDDRRYRLRQRAGRLLSITPLSMFLAALGGALLQTIDAADIWFYVFVIPLGAATVMQILAPGAGLPRPGFARGRDVFGWSDSYMGAPARDRGAN